ncbi:MAG: aminotransferase class I/II-fold pyridoxal phosphate-dependent enzyme [Christensenellaceae bacterium]|jgi:histidinol-phosphate aminotransferase|nr:aminotransferase class I/II-fold pyridoxal phosphate-dependent enzyme [Christensenellaceae bacterium]
MKLTKYTIEDHLSKLMPYNAINDYHAYPIRLDANESFINADSNPWVNPSSLLSEVQYNRYPDPTCKKLIKAFSDYYSVSPDCVTVGNGSDELIALICELFLEDKSTLLTTRPDFSMYSFYPYLRRAQVDYYIKPSTLDIDADALIDLVNQVKPNILVFSNPCNPTGKMLGVESVLKIIENSECLTIVDEAYMDFSSDYQSVIAKINNYENLIVLKTASKFGFAALRLGFSVANKNLNRVLSSAKSPYNINSICQILGEFAFKNSKSLNQNIDTIRNSRIQLYEGLQKFHSVLNSPFIAIESNTNFVYVKSLKCDAIFEELKRAGILVRNFGDALRITCGTTYENSMLFSTLNAINGGTL